MPVKSGHVPISEVFDWIGTFVLIAGVLLFLFVGQFLTNLTRKKEETAERGGPLPPQDSSSALLKQVAVPVTMAHIDQMDGLTFERFLKALFERQGYIATITPHYDWGGDLVLHKDGVRTLVQAKRWKHQITMSAVQEVVAAKAKYRADRVMVVTNSTFTYKAKELARVNDVVLWSRETLTTQLRLFPVTVTHGTAQEFTAPCSTEPQKANHEISRANNSEVQAQEKPSPCCALCRKSVTEAVADYCRTNALRFDNQIYCFSHQKAFARRKEANSPTSSEAISEDALVTTANAE